MAGEVARLGDFGDAGEAPPRQPLRAEFGWYGKTIRANPDASELDMVEFMAGAADIDMDDVSTDDMARVAPVMWTFLRRCVHPADWETFWQQVRRHDVQPEVLLALCKAVVEAVQGRPTTPQPASTSGGAGTAPASTDGTSPLDDPATRAALAAAHGNPSLALGVLEAWEARQPALAG